MGRRVFSSFSFSSFFSSGFCSVLALGAVSCAHAAERKVEEVYVIGEASKTETSLVEQARSVSVVDARQMELQNVTSLGEALRYTPGVVSEPFGFEPRLSFLRLRGFDASQDGLYRDGVKLSNPGFVVSYSLEPYGAEQFQVLRGPEAVLYGQTNPGGVIDYISKRPQAETHGEIGLEFGSHDRKQAQLDVTGAIDGQGEFLYRLTALTRKSNTQIDFIHDDRTFVAPAVTWNISDATNITLQVHWQSDNTRSSQALPVAGTLFSNPNGKIPVERFTGEPEVDRYERDEYSVGYLLEHEFREGLRFRQNLRYYEIELEDVSVYSASVLDSRTIGRTFFENFGDLEGFALDNRLLIDVGRHDLFVGLDYRHFNSTSLRFSAAAPSLDIFNPVYGAQIPDPDSPFRNEEATQEQYGLYFQSKINVTERWLLSLGGRFDSTENQSEDAAAGSSHSQTDEEFVTNAGLMYQADNGLTPYISYAESFLSVLGADSTGRGFDPEKGEQVEVGVKYQPFTSTLVTLAWFDLTRQNFTQFDPDTFEQVQTGEVNSQGFELEAITRLPLGLELSLSYTDLEVKVTESNVPEEVGEDLTQVPDRTGSIWASYEFDQGTLAGLGLGLGVRHLGSSYGDIPNTLKSPSETLVDLELHYDWEDLRLQLNAHNLLDEEYIASTFVRGGSEFASYGPTQRITASIQYRW